MTAVHTLVSHFHAEWLDATDTHHCAFHCHKLACSCKHAITLRHMCMYVLDTVSISAILLLQFLAFVYITGCPC